MAKKLTFAEAQYIRLNRKLQLRQNILRNKTRSCVGVSYGSEFARKTAGKIYAGVKGCDRGFFYFNPAVKKLVDELLLSGLQRQTITGWLEKFHGFTGVLLFTDDISVKAAA